MQIFKTRYLIDLDLFRIWYLDFGIFYDILPALTGGGLPYLTKDDISGSIHPRAHARSFLETVIKTQRVFCRVSLVS